jgi:hypothetical protein
MPKKRAPSEGKAQELAALLQGHPAAERGEERVRHLVPLATERGLQEAFAHEQTAVLGRQRYARHGPGAGYRTGYADGPLKSAAGVLRVPLPQGRGLHAPLRSQRWATLAQTSAHRKTLSGERWGGACRNAPLKPPWRRHWGTSSFRKAL